MRKQLRIVLADDHAIVRSGLRGLIEQEDDMLVVGEADSGEDAVRLAAELQPDVVVMDLSMPGAGGLAATERITDESPDVRVLVLTMHDDRGHLVRLLEAGAAGYILKAAAGDELLRAIRAVGADQSYVDPSLSAALLRRPRGRKATGTEPQELSAREEEVLRRIAWGESNKAIAAALEISTRTVETYKARIHEKLGLRSRPEIVRYALERGWLIHD
jgi:DNA-binding NarL/FixJ family response regulator